jgi:hypothetical protein
MRCSNRAKESCCPRGRDEDEDRDERSNGMVNSNDRIKEVKKEQRMRLR